MVLLGVVEFRAPEAPAGERGQHTSETAVLSLRERPGDGEHVIVNRHRGTHKTNIASRHHRIKCADRIGERAGRAVYRDKRFRQALSHAIDRDEINDIAFQGLATPLLGFARGDEPFYDEEVQAAEQEAIRYDVDEANRLLDEVGLTNRDADGYRLTSDRGLDLAHRARR